MNKNSIRLDAYKKLYPYLKYYRFDLIAIIIIKLIISAISIINIYFYKILVDDVIIKSNVKNLFYLIIGYITLFVLETVCLAFLTRQNQKVFNKLKLNIRNKIFKEISNMKIHEMQDCNIADLKMNVCDDIEILDTLINSHFLDYMICFLKIFVYFVILLKLNVLLTILVSLSIPLFFLITKRLQKEVNKVADKARDTHAEYNSWLHGSLSGWKDIQTTNFYENEEKKFASFWTRTIQISNLQFVNWFCGRSITLIKDFLIINILLYFVGGILIINGYFTIGNMLIYINYFQTFFNTVNEINNLNLSINEIAPIFNRIYKLMKNEKKIAMKLPDVSSYNFNMNQVNFHYRENLGNVLQDINLNIQNNEKIFIKGKSGHGKSTLVKLLLNFYQPQTGSITLNGINIDSINPIDYHKFISASLQDNFLFNMSIMDNILLANSTAKKEEVIKACKLAQIHDYIETLPNSYDTVIIENGENLSGGQKQRLFIARIILRNPEIIILDEATIALDIKTEKLIFDLIGSEFLSKTVIVVSHNEDNISYANRVIMVDEHRIVKDILL